MNNLKTQTWELEMNTDIRAVNCNEEMTWRTYRMSRIKHVCDRPLHSHLGFVRFLQRIVHTGSKQKPDVPIPRSSSVASCLLGLPQNWIGKLCWKTLWCFSSCAISFRKNNEQGRIFSFMDTGIRGSGENSSFFPVYRGQLCDLRPIWDDFLYAWGFLDPSL